MKKLIFLFLILIPFLLNAQQINYTWGETTAGVAYSQTGTVDADSASTIDIVFDLQDYYLGDFNPLFSDDSVVIGNSNRLFLGTLWVRVDSDSANDSTNFYVQAYPGGRIYDDNDENRIEAAEINFSTTAITLRDTTTANGNISDVQWTPINVYIHATVRVLPPEYMKITIGFDVQSFGGTGNGNVYAYLAYPAIYEREQANRTTTHPKDAKKARETMH